MSAPDKTTSLTDLVIEMGIATREEIGQFQKDALEQGKKSLWNHLKEIGRLTQPQADTLDMAAKGYIPIESARVSIQVQSKSPHHQPSSPDASAHADDDAPRSFLKIQRSGRSPSGSARDVLPPKDSASGDSTRSSAPAPTGEPTVKDQEKLPTAKIEPQSDPPSMGLSSRRQRSEPSPSSIAAWKQIVDNQPSRTPMRDRNPSTSPVLPVVMPAVGKDLPAALERQQAPRQSGPPPISSLAGRRLGKYQLSSQIGRGASGAVFMGHHVVLNMPVAVKVLEPSIAHNHPELLKRFMYEARSAARITHPNIIRVIDCDQIDGLYLIVMEFVDGISAAELIKINGQIAEERALIVVQAVAEGLEAALEAGIIHRDIKPANIMITKNKQVKLADLGLAKRVDEPADMSDTRPNIGLGTPHFFAPEQAVDASSADHRSDIYSLGATLYNMLTGVVPFKGKTIVELIRKHHEDHPVPPHQIVPQVSRATSDFALYMMAKRPQDRPQNYTELLNVVNACIYNLKHATSSSDHGTKTGTTIVRDILNLFSTRK